VTDKSQEAIYRVIDSYSIWSEGVRWCVRGVGDNYEGVTIGLRFVIGSTGEGINAFRPSEDRV